MTRKIRLNRPPVFSIDGYRETGRLWRRMRVVGFNTGKYIGPVRIFSLCFLILVKMTFLCFVCSALNTPQISFTYA